MRSRPVLACALAAAVAGCVSSGGLEAEGPGLPARGEGGVRAVTWSAHSEVPGCQVNLGPTGAKAWLDTYELRVGAVEEGSPAEGLLARGDRIFGAGGTVFGPDADPRMTVGAAVTEAEAADGVIPFLVERGGANLRVEVVVPALGAYARTWPYDCAKSRAILRNACEYLAEAQFPDGHLVSDSHMATPYTGLLFVATGEERYLDGARRAAYWLCDRDISKFSLANWPMGYSLVFLCEYYLATGDAEVLGGIEKTARSITEGQMRCGSWGHNPGAGGYGALNQAGIVCAMGLALARECDVKIDEAAFARAVDFFAKYAGRGSIPYGDHLPGNNADDNGKNSAAAVLFDLLADRPEAVRVFSESTAVSYWLREEGHTGPFLSILWGPLGCIRAGREKFRSFMDYQTWYYDLCRTWDGGFTISPYQEALTRFDGNAYVFFGPEFTTGGIGLTYALPLQKLRIMGAPRGVFGRKLEGRIADARGLYLARKWDEFDAAIASVRDGGDAGDRRLADELALAARTHRASVGRTLAEIANNLANRDPYRAFEQYRGLERLLGGGDERVKELKARFEEKQVKWLTDEGRKYYQAWNDLRTVAFMNWIPYGIQARRLVGRPPELRPRFWEDLVPTSERSPVAWRIHRWDPLGKAKGDAGPDAPPPAGWESAELDDSSWPEAQGPFGPGKGGKPGWDTRSIALRKSFVLDDAAVDRLRLLVKCPRESVTDAYVNGVKVASAVLGPKRNYAKIELGDGARELLRRGANLLAVRCTHASTRPQGIDVGLQWCARRTRGPVASRRGRVVPMPEATPSAPPARHELTIRRPKERYLERLEQSYDAKAVDELVAGLTDVIPYHRRLAAGALARKGADAVPRVIEALEAGRWHVRRGACDALAEVARLHRGGRRKEEIDEATKEARAEAYRKALEAVPSLAGLLRDEELWVRHGAASALAAMEGDAAASADALVAAAADGDKWVREAVIGAVQKVTKDTGAHLRAAANVLLQPDVSFAVTRHAIGVLTKHGKEYREAVPALRYFVANPGEGMWACVAPAMELLVGLESDPEAVVPLLADVVRGGPRYYRLRGGPREKAAELLGKLGAKARPALPVLKAVVEGDDEREAALREAAKKAVELIAGE